MRLELALLGHLFTIAIKVWGIGLPFNPESNIRRLAPARAVPLTAEATRVFIEALANPVRPAEPDRRSQANPAGGHTAPLPVRQRVL